MALNRQALVPSEHFVGQAHIASKREEGLTAVVRGVLQKLAQIRLEAAAVGALTDSSGGVAGASIAAVTVPAETDVSGGTTGATAASINTGLDTVSNAWAVILEKLNLVLAELGAGSVGEGEGTIAISGTIAVIDDTVAANTNDTDSALYATVRQAFQDHLDAQATVIEVVNLCRRAVGLADVPVAAGAGSNQGEVLPGLEIPATITNATTSPDAVSSVLRTEVDAAIDVFSDNIALLADQIDAVAAITEAGNPLANAAA